MRTHHANRAALRPDCGEEHVTTFDEFPRATGCDRRFDAIGIDYAGTHCEFRMVNREWGRGSVQGWPMFMRGLTG